MNQYDHFKDKLHDYAVKTDKEKIWRNTAHAIPQRRKRRVIILFLLGTLAGAGWLGYSLNTKGPGTSLVVNENFMEPGAIQENIGGNQPDHSMTTTIKTTDQMSGSKPQKTKPNIRSYASKLSPRKKTASEKSVAGITDVSVFDVQATDNGLEHSQPTSAASPSMTNEDDLEILQSYDPSSLTFTPDYARAIAAVTFPLPHPAVPFPDELNSMKMNSAEVPLIAPGNSRKQVSFSVMAAIGISSLDIRGLNNEAKETAALLNRTVRSLEHLSVVVVASLPLRHDMAVETKLGWNQWTTETRQQITSYEPFTREGVSGIVIDEDGARHPVTGLVNGVQVLHKDLVRFTQYQTMEAALALHKVLWRVQRMSVGAFAEGTFVIHDQASGSTYDTEWELHRFSKQDNPFVRKSLFGFGGGIQMNYLISPHLRLSGTLSYQPVKYQWQLAQQQIEWTHSRLRSQLGIRYLLN